MTEILYKELSYKIVGILFDVYNELGAGYVERVYQKALARAFTDKGIKFKEQLCCKLKYKDTAVGEYFLDFLIEDKIVLEIKSNMRFLRKEYEQINNYLNITGIKLGILATFANKSVKYCRVLNVNDASS
jgi:GxxExxY protein